MRKLIALLSAAMLVTPAFAGGITSTEPHAINETVSASASEIPDLSGFYIGLGLGLTDIDDPQRNYSTSQGGYAGGILNGWEAALKDRSAQVSITLGHSWTFGRMIAGLEARYVRQRLDDTAFETYNGIVDTDYTSRYKSQSSRQILARLGRVFGDAAVGYIVAGKAYTQYQRTYTLLGILEDVASNTDTGVLLGIGYERFLNDTWSVRGEISRINYDREINTVVNAYREDAVHEATQNNISLSLMHHF